MQTAERYRQALRTIGGYDEPGEPVCRPEEKWDIFADALKLAIAAAEERERWREDDVI